MGGGATNTRTTKPQKCKNLWPFGRKGADALTQNRFHTSLRPALGPTRRLLAVGALLWATSTPCAVTWQSSPPGTAPARFLDVAAAAGVTFVHRHSPTADKHYPESVPGGVAVFDYNADGKVLIHPCGVVKGTLLHGLRGSLAPPYEGIGLRTGREQENEQETSNHGA